MRKSNFPRDYGSPERKIEAKILKEENVEKLRRLLEKQLTEIKKRIPELEDFIDNSCRIEPGIFSKIYSKEVIEKDIKDTEDKEIKFYFESFLRTNKPFVISINTLRGFLNDESIRKIDKAVISRFIEELRKMGEGAKEIREKLLEKAREEKLKTKGEQLEMFKTLMFNEFLGSDYCSLRTSSYDDIKNGIDNIILDLKTGEIICAIDETGDVGELELSEKRNNIRHKNYSGKGGELKYGIIIKEREISLGKIFQIPILYLPLSIKDLNQGIERLISCFKKLDKPSSDSVLKTIFDYWTSEIKGQMETIQIYLEPENPLRKRIDNFKKAFQG